MIFTQMENVMITIIRQARIIQDVDRHTFFQLAVITAFLDPMEVHIAPANVNLLAFGCLRLDIENGLLVVRSIHVCIKIKSFRGSSNSIDIFSYQH